MENTNRWRILDSWLWEKCLSMCEKCFEICKISREIVKSASRPPYFAVSLTGLLLALPFFNFHEDILIIDSDTCWQIRFLHDPSKDTGFVGCALTSNMVRFFKTPNGSWSHEVSKYQCFPSSHCLWSCTWIIDFCCGLWREKKKKEQMDKKKM